MTEIDFITKTTSTVRIADEAGSEVVQLSYFKQARHFPIEPSSQIVLFVLYSLL